jgi:hypothetical protein
MTCQKDGVEKKNKYYSNIHDGLPVVFSKWSANGFFGIIALLLLISACAPSFPKAPEVDTRQGRNCLRHCQKDYNDWTRQCTGTDLKAPSRQSCISDCIRDLKKCYQQCVKDEKNQPEKDL